MSGTKAYALVSFDLDGTLVDTAAEIAEAVNRSLKAHGLAPQPTAEIVKLIGAGTQAVTQLPWLLLLGAPDDFTRAWLMGAAWGINLMVAEGLIWRRRRVPMRVAVA